MENVGKYRDIKLVTRKRGRNYCLSEPNYHIFHLTKFFIDTFLALEMRKTQILMNKSVVLI